MPVWTLSVRTVHGEHQFPAFDFGHIQNIVNQAKQMLAGKRDFPKAVLHLLCNAIKFTPEGGSISLSMHEEPSPVGEDYVRIHIYVKDTGIGIFHDAVPPSPAQFRRPKPILR